ncbi:hypothetical protein C8Q80DRAFT_1268584 [Daedaleopsis nitida]|nr:hypothetical protein C8Q80DRAFT_1268584 [Daedaleopsis nitida]
MPATSTLTRAQFDEACRAYVAAHPNTHPSEVKTYPLGWTWTEHAYVCNLGYLSRVVHLPSRATSSDVAEDDTESPDCSAEHDDAVCDVPSLDSSLTCNQYIVYSSTFQVPTLYFTLHDTSGSPLALDQIVKTALFRPHALPTAEGNAFALTLPNSAFALLSQGDHPTLGTPSWYFHPCHTTEVMGELMAEIEDSSGDGLRWMEAWFMVMGNMVDFFAGE